MIVFHLIIYLKYAWEQESQGNLFSDVQNHSTYFPFAGERQSGVDRSPLPENRLLMMTIFRIKYTIFSLDGCMVFSYRWL